MTLALVLVAVSLLLAGRSSTSPAAVAAGGPASLSVGAMRSLSCLAVSIGCLALLGIERGTACAAIAAPMTGLGLTRLHARPRRLRATPSLALALDLVSAALQAGQPLANALLLAAPAVDDNCGAELARVGGLLQLGADPADAWRAAADDPVLAPVAAAARRSAASGIRLAATFAQSAHEVRAQLRASATSRAERAGVFAAAPLGLCFLPSFVCLGIVPTVVSVAGNALHGLS